MRESVEIIYLHSPEEVAPLNGLVLPGYKHASDTSEGNNKGTEHNGLQKFYQNDPKQHWNKQTNKQMS